MHRIPLYTIIIATEDYISVAKRPFQKKSGQNFYKNGSQILGAVTLCNLCRGIIYFNKEGFYAYLPKSRASGSRIAESEAMLSFRL